MSHQIPKDALNSKVQYCIDEYVRCEKHRDILRDKWFKLLTIEEIAEKYDTSETTVKSIIYGIGDEILLKALKMSTE